MVRTPVSLPVTHDAPAVVKERRQGEEDRLLVLCLCDGWCWMSVPLLVTPIETKVLEKEQCSRAVVDGFIH